MHTRWPARRGRAAVRAGDHLVVAREAPAGYDPSDTSLSDASRSGKAPFDTASCTTAPSMTAPPDRGPSHASRPDAPWSGLVGAGDGQADRVAAAIAAIDRTETTGDGELAELTATLRAADRLMARAVALAGAVDGRRAAAEEAMTVDAAVQLHTGAARSDVSVVLTAGDVLAKMPATARLFADGVLSWGHIRALTTGVRRLDATARAGLDEYLGVHAGRLAGLEPERRLWALDNAVAEFSPLKQVEDPEQRQTETEFLALQPRLDGSGSAYGEFSPESFATIADRLAAEADAPQAPPCPGDTHGPSETPPTRAQQLAAALLRLCQRGSDGGSDTAAGSPVRAAVIVDLERVTDTAAAEIAAGARGRPAKITRRALGRLTCDATLGLVVREGVDLLAAKRYAPEISAATRRAVTVRDGGCRFPGCTAPVSWCGLHHVEQRAAGGGHAPTNLVALCRRHHTTVHRRGWAQTLQRDGTYRLRRRRRDWTTLPRHDQQLPPPRPTGPGTRDGPGTRNRDGPEEGPPPRDRSDPTHTPTVDTSGAPDPDPMPF